MALSSFSSSLLVTCPISILSGGGLSRLNYFRGSRLCCQSSSSPCLPLVVPCLSPGQPEEKRAGEDEEPLLAAS